MTKSLPILLIAISAIAFLCAAVIVACTAAKDIEDESSDTSSSAITETVSEQTHLAGSESSESILLSESTTTVFESSSEITTETNETTSLNESDVESSENTSEMSESTSVITETALETTTEEESEAETETEPIHVPSLSFTSNGNGTCTVTGIGDVTDSYISIPSRSPEGDIVTAIAEKAFFSNNTIKAVEIPSTIMSISDMAFSNCQSLLYIAVDDNNTMFTDINGVLFSKNLSHLICYPSGSGLSSFDIPITTTSIAPMAFYNCANLRSVLYQGNVEQWSAINIGAQNYGLIAASISFK